MRLYYDAPYVTLNKQSTINPAQLKITRSDDQEVKSKQLKTVLLPAHGIQSITRYLSCNSGKTRIEEKDEKLLKCAQCGLSQLSRNAAKEFMQKLSLKPIKDQFH